MHNVTVLSVPGNMSGQGGLTLIPLQGTKEKQKGDVQVFMATVPMYTES